jgi:DNA-binding NtrC family response regulator
MFGHSRGAFTGAMQTRQGLVRTATGGTLFLDEVDSLPQSAQAKLLRFLETGEYRAVGSDHVELSDAWVIAATNQNLPDRVRGGSFRADLMYRLAVVELPVPPLRQRSGDIRQLAQHFLAEIDPGKRCDEEALLAMESYDWPGNVRELKHRVQSAALLTEGDTIGLREMHFLEGSTPREPDRPQGASLPQDLQHELWDLVDGGGMTLAQAISECERLLVQSALLAEKNNRTRAAGRLGIHVRTMFKKIKRPDGSP